MVKKISLFSRKHITINWLWLLFVIISFLIWSTLTIIYAKMKMYFPVLMGMILILFSVFAFEDTLKRCINSTTSKIIIDYESKSITINLKKRFYYKDVHKEKKCSIYLQAHFNEIDGIELKEVEDKGLTNIKINVNGKETDIPMDKVLELWKTPQKEQFVEELIQELEILAKAIKETKQI